MLFRFNESITMNLPEGVRAEWEENQCRIYGEAGTEGILMSAAVGTVSYYDRKRSGESVIDCVMRTLPKTSRAVVSQKRDALLYKDNQEFNSDECLLRCPRIVMLSPLDEKKVFLLSCTCVDVSKIIGLPITYQYALAISNGVCINGRKIHFDITDSELKRVLEQSMPEAVAILPRLYENLVLSESHLYTTKRYADFIGQPIRRLMEDEDKHWMTEYDDLLDTSDYHEDEKALEFARLFRVSRAEFDPYNDTEAFIHNGMFTKARMLHSLRSFAWTLNKMAKQNDRTLDSFTFQELQEIGQFIREKNDLNYDVFSFELLPQFSNYYTMCGQPDWHVYYLPDDFESDEDMRSLCGKEDRQGNVTYSMSSIWMLDPEAERIRNIINRNEENCASLDDLRNELISLEPVMQTIHDGLQRMKSIPDGACTDALIAWCALCVAAKEPFYSEEACEGSFDPLPYPGDKDGWTPTVVKSPKKTAGKTAAKRPASSNTSKAANIPNGYECLTLNEFNFDEKTHTLKSYYGSDTHLVLPAKIKTIGNNAFSYNETLDSIIIPEGVHTIESYAFYCCNQLKSITIPEGVRTIGEYAFYSCEVLESISLPSTVETIATYAFACCRALKCVHIPVGVREISASAFEDCDALEEVVLPSTLQGIGECAFNGCPALTHIQLPASLQTIDDDAFDETDIVFETQPGSVGEAYAERMYRRRELRTEMIPEGIQAIEARAYRKHELLESITLPSTVETIGERAFEECKALKEITIPQNVRVIEAAAFAGCEVLTSVTLSASIEKIGSGAFSDCKQLETIILPEGIREIEDNAFAWCEALTSVTLPASVEKIGSGAFRSCKQLGTIVLPEGIREIEDNAFAWCEALTSVTLPASVEKIGSGAFNGCKMLKTIVLPEGIQEIESETFARCEALKSIILPAAVKKLGSGAFNQCKRLKGIELPKDLQRIEAYLFANCAALESLTIPASVESIGERAFEGCRRINGLTLPENLRVIEENAFSECVALEGLALPASLERIGSGAFKGCRMLTEIAIPEKIQIIEKGSFSGCRQLKSLTIPNTVQKIKEDAFHNCTSLASVRLSKNVMEIEKGNFHKKMVIRTSRRSEAEKYAQKRRMTIVYSGERKSPQKTTAKASAPAPSAVKTATAAETQPAKPAKPAQQSKDKPVSTPAAKKASTQKPASVKQSQQPKAQPVQAKPAAAPTISPQQQQKNEAEEAIRSLEKKVQELEAEKTRLHGLFSLLKKRRLQAEIDALRLEIENRRK